METKAKKILAIGGPTGVGENTVVGEICKKYPIFKRLTTATTRVPREGEQNEIDYYFMSNEDFLKKVENGQIPEYQNSRDKNVYYGTYLSDLEKKLSEGFNVIITPDIVGAKYFKDNWDATTIFLMPDSMENLKKRQLKRSEGDPSVTKEELENRMKYAEYEIKNEKDFYDFEVVNAQNKLDNAVNEIISIIKKEGYKLED
ncbi:MAG: hypothetical protein PF549_05045 [Patescibacteria group bacterium]|nr:hypothetical protein [Patescibacteria group bacterium]